MPTKRRKHIPQRTCVICGTTTAKRDLTRLVHTADTGVQLDPTGKLAGRGAYLCDNPLCWAEAAHGRTLEKALRIQLTHADRAMIAAQGKQLMSAARTE